MKVHHSCAHHGSSGAVNDGGWFMPANLFVWWFGGLVRSSLRKALTYKTKIHFTPLPLASLQASTSEFFSLISSLSLVFWDIIMTQAFFLCLWVTYNLPFGHLYFHTKEMIMTSIWSCFASHPWVELKCIHHPFSADTHMHTTFPQGTLKLYEASSCLLFCPVVLRNFPKQQQVWAEGKVLVQ